MREGSGNLNVNQPRPRLEIHLRYFESRVQLIYRDGAEGNRNLEHLLSESCSEPEKAEARSVPGRLGNLLNIPRRRMSER